MASRCLQQSTAQGRLGFFPGSTIGNFIPRSGVDMLRHMRDILQARAKYLLIGFDRIKSLDILIPAYDDAAGVTAAFNLNVLHRINRELDGDIPVDAFCPSMRAGMTPRRGSKCTLRRHAMFRFAVAGENFEMAKATLSIPKTATNMICAACGCCFALAAGHTIADYSDADDWFTLVLAQARPILSAP